MKLRLLQELWEFRGFIASCVRREFQGKYTNSLFGFAWTIANPLAMILVYTVIFAQVMRARLPGVDNTFAYSIFLCAGIFTWGVFEEITRRSQAMFIDNANLLKKLRFPRICLPAVVIANALVNFAIIFLLFTIFLIVSGNFPGLAFFSYFPLLFLLIAFSTGMGMVLGVINVFFRDVGQAFGIALLFWFWLTPIVYAPTILPNWFKSFAALNPLAVLFGQVQAVFVMGAWPAWGDLTYMAACTILLCWLGFSLFRRHVAEMVDEL